MYGNGSTTGGQRTIIPSLHLKILKDLLMEPFILPGVVPGMMNGGEWTQHAAKGFNPPQLECIGWVSDVSLQQNNVFNSNIKI